MMKMILMREPNLRHACESIGFFYLKVSNERLSHELITRVFAESKAFFDLPVEAKRLFSDPILNVGYTGMEEETLDVKRQKLRGDTKEGYYISKDIPESSPLYNPSKLAGPNIWPTQNNLSSGEKEDLVRDLNCAKWKEVMNEYFDGMSSLAFQMVQYIALAIGLSSKHYFDNDFQNPMAFLRLLHYSNEKSIPDEGIFACGAHSDYGMVTLLATDHHGGLQILVPGKNDDNEEEWLDVPPPPIGTFVVNLGDMLERWTNGKFRSTIHRVLSRGDERYSIPFFYEPNFDTVVECLDVCLKPGQKAKYPPTTSGQHLLDKYKETHSDFQHEER